jgi:hypothetical protein
MLKTLINYGLLPIKLNKNLSRFDKFCKNTIKIIISFLRAR